MPEHVLRMQSSQAQDKAARQYVVLNATNPNLLFRTFRVFNLYSSCSWGSGWWRLLGDFRVPADRRILAGFVIWGPLLGGT